MWWRQGGENSVKEDEWKWIIGNIFETNVFKFFSSAGDSISSKVIQYSTQPLNTYIQHYSNRIFIFFFFIYMFLSWTFNIDRRWSIKIFYKDRPLNALGNVIEVSKLVTHSTITSTFMQLKLIVIVLFGVAFGNCFIRVLITFVRLW